jgi:superfamily I DNA and/or RNA helicase
MFIDIKRARLGGVKPLPQRIKSDSGEYKLLIEEEKVENLHSIPEEILLKELEPLKEKEFSRQDLWERKLLDLSLRNNLLNLRSTKTLIQLLTNQIDKLEDQLAKGTEFTLLNKPEEWIPSIPTRSIYPSLSKNESINSLLDKDIELNRIRTYISPKELEKSITFLYRKSKTALEENGANTLFLTIGSLKWYETEFSDKPRFAPILLVPIEIIRKSSRRGYILRTREEETIINVTLLEMLRHEFNIEIGSLEDLPKDESGIDVNMVFTIIRQHILEQSRWSVEEINFIGTFSFSKFMLWNDIHHHADKLSQNKVVKSLIQGSLNWQPEINKLQCPPNSPELNKLLLPINADASQIDAVFAANQGASFVLHGPPGTGKSQTITNIIANVLYQDKKVLFVAEKMAALSVVEKRLEKLGISPFCLELHSNKVKKSSVLKQLEETTEVIKKTSPKELKEQQEKLHSLKSELLQYSEDLHRKQPIGLSLFEAFSEITLYKDIQSLEDFHESFLENLSKEDFNLQKEMAQELEATGKLCDHPSIHPLLGIDLKDGFLPSESEWNNILRDLQSKAKALQNTLLELKEWLNPAFSKQQLYDFMDLLSQLLELNVYPKPLIAGSQKEENWNKIKNLLPTTKKHQHLRKELLSKIIKDGLNLEAERLINNWKKAENKWFLSKWWQQRKIKSQVKNISKTDSVSNESVLLLLYKLEEYQNLARIIKREKSPLQNILQNHYKEHETDWDSIEVGIEKSQAFYSEFNIWMNSYNLETEVLSKLDEILTNRRQYFDKNYLDYFSDLIIRFKEFKDSFDHSEKEISIDEQWINRQNPFLDSLETSLLSWINNFSETRIWSQWCLVKNKAKKANLDILIKEYEEGNIANEQVSLVFNKSILTLLIETIPNKYPSLQMFNGAVFENKIQKFQDITRYIQKLSEAELQTKLASNIPDFTLDAATSSEMGVLQKAIRSKGRGMSIRKLFDSIPNLLPKINPCMLMSPLSVAQYLSANPDQFDIVIFDEASQLPTCDAVGAMARGKNIIVVGDPKQMPPTSFFSSNRYDENLNDIEDLESILDDCLALSMPSKHLLWHYRSKHESLIAFSNANYYDYRLRTFPSPDDLAIKVNHIAVEGYYDKGKTRQNTFEAGAIVEYILNHYQNKETAQKSLGVVTFSMVQQQLIDDLLMEKLVDKPEIEEKIWNSEEPLFIKNLENVQGDERDIILFSIGYAPDKNGKLSLNFGPLNREGGWRRLNVAVTRSRYQMLVFSTLKSEQINLSKTKSKGLIGLKAFIEYAEKGKFALSSNRISTNNEEYLLVEEIAYELEKAGFKVKTNIGYSDFKIDLGIVHPQKPNEYILGIRTDGDFNAQETSVKDRAFTQPLVLSHLNWKIFRIWALDWWFYSDKVIENIKNLVHDLQESKDRLTETNQPKEEFTITQDVIEENKLVYYTPTKFSFQESGDIYSESSKSKILNQAEKIISQEAPILQSLFNRRLLEAWVTNRLGSKLEQYLDDIVKKQEWNITQEGEEFLIWNNDQNPDDYSQFRIAKNINSLRNVEQIPIIEIENVLLYILHQQYSIEHEDLLKEAANLMGIKRVTAKTKARFQLGVDGLIQKEKINFVNKKIQINNMNTI